MDRPHPADDVLDRAREVLRVAQQLTRETGLRLLAVVDWHPDGFRRWKARRMYRAKPSAN